MDSIPTVCVRENGLRIPVVFNPPITADHGRIRLRVCFEGIRPEDAHLHAIYLGDPA